MNIKWVLPFVSSYGQQLRMLAAAVSCLSVFETGFHLTQIGLEHITCWRLALNPLLSCLGLLDARIIGICQQMS